MDRVAASLTCYLLIVAVLAAFGLQKATASTFTIINSCEYTVWPGVQAGAGTPPLSTTGFELPSGQTVALDVPAGWSGRLWGRTLCTFDSTGKGKCATGDCSTGLQCSGNNVAPPATLAEFTLGKTTTEQDFYDVSLVDGFNVAMMVDTKGGQGACTATGCLADINRFCPKDLQVDGNVACKSACEAFNTPEYCCSGEFGNPNTCKPSAYSQLFKTACPRSYSYAYDDASSTFTCAAADYIITFCPTSPGQRRSSSPAASDSASPGTDTDTDTARGYGAWDVSTTGSPSSAKSNVSRNKLYLVVTTAVSAILLHRL